MNVHTEGLFRCRKCGLQNPVCGFYTTNAGRIGRICKKCKSLSKKEYRNGPGREKLLAWTLANREYLKAYHKTWIRNNPNAIRAYAKKRAKKYNEYRRSWESERYKNDPSFRAMKVIRNKLWVAMNRNVGCRARKSSKTKDLLGCSPDELVIYIESKFKFGMSWGNHGLHGWHIDHIRPCASFDLTDPEQQKACFHYTNLQPLWAKENLKKGIKYEN